MQYFFAFQVISWILFINCRAFPCYVRFPNCIEVTNYCFGRSCDCSPFSMQLCWMWWVSSELRERLLPSFKRHIVLSCPTHQFLTETCTFFAETAQFLESRSMEWCTFQALATCGSPFRVALFMASACRCTGWPQKNMLSSSRRIQRRLMVDWDMSCK